MLLPQRGACLRPCTPDSVPKPKARSLPSLGITDTRAEGSQAPLCTAHSKPSRLFERPLLARLSPSHISLATCSKRMTSHSAATLRLMSDLKAISQQPPEGCSASPASDENLFVWTASIFGPDETPWEGGVFSLRITFGESYPEKPPRVRFTSEVFHPNVYADGTLCLDTIQDAWSPCHNICTILTSVQSLLTDPNCASPANPEAAQLYQNNKSEFNRRVRRLAQRSVEQG